MRSPLYEVERGRGHSRQPKRKLQKHRLKRFPLLLKEGWPGPLIIRYLQGLFPAGVVDLLISFYLYWHEKQ